MHSPKKISFAAEQLKRQQKTNPVVWILIGVAVVSLIVGGYAFYHKSMKQKKVETETEQISSIAVLPFRNFSESKSFRTQST